MKKILAVLISLILISMLTTTVYANNMEVEKLSNNISEQDEIKKIDKNIKEFLSACIESEFLSPLPDNYKINYDNAYKIYMGEDFLTLKNNENKSLKDYIAKAEYIWILTVNYMDKCFQINLAKDQGEWVVSTIKIDDVPIDYPSYINEKLTDSNLNGSEMYIVGGIPIVYKPVGIILDEKEAKYIVPVDQLIIEGSIAAKKELAPQNIPIENGVYKFEAFQKALVNLEKAQKSNNNSQTGGGTSLILYTDDEAENINDGEVLFYILVGIVVIIFVSIIFIITKKQINKS